MADCLIVAVSDGVSRRAGHRAGADLGSWGEANQFCGPDIQYLVLTGGKGTLRDEDGKMSVDLIQLDGRVQADCGLGRPDLASERAQSIQYQPQAQKSN